MTNALQRIICEDLFKDLIHEYIEYAINTGKLEKNPGFPAKKARVETLNTYNCVRWERKLVDERESDPCQKGEGCKVLRSRKGSLGCDVREGANPLVQMSRVMVHGLNSRQVRLDLRISRVKRMGIVEAVEIW